MKLKALFCSGCISVALAYFAAPAAAATVHECVAGKPTPESYTWNFKAETDNTFQKIQSEARSALYHADQLQMYAQDGLSWESQGDELNAVKDEVNGIESQLCRLETIRRVDAPWQKNEIDKIKADAQYMVDNAQDAILFLNAHQDNLWIPVYRKYTDNLYVQARNLERSVHNAVAYVNVSKEYRDLSHSMKSPGVS